MEKNRFLYDRALYMSGYMPYIRICTVLLLLPAVMDIIWVQLLEEIPTVLYILCAGIELTAAVLYGKISRISAQYRMAAVSLGALALSDIFMLWYDRKQCFIPFCAIVGLLFIFSRYMIVCGHIEALAGMASPLPRRMIWLQRACKRLCLFGLLQCIPIMVFGWQLAISILLPILFFIELEQTAAMGNIFKGYIDGT